MIDDRGDHEERDEPGLHDDPNVEQPGSQDEPDPGTEDSGDGSDSTST